MINDKARRSVIQFEDVSFEYPGAETESIHHISLDIKKGEFLVLTGGSGCGKTTLTRLINGLAEQFYEGTLKGRVTLLGRSISEYPLYEIGKKVGSIFQDPKSQFFASITEDEIAFGCENYGVPYEELDGRVSSAIKRINGDMLRGKEIYPMSSGEKQKIAVASAGHGINLFPTQHISVNTLNCIGNPPIQFFIGNAIIFTPERNFILCNTGKKLAFGVLKD